MSHLMNKISATVTAIALATTTVLSSGAALAATQGILAATSTGSTNISVTKSTVAQITGLTDMTLASYLIGSGDQALSSDACVYSSTAGGHYTVTATGSGASSAFTLSDGASHNIPYNVVWNSSGPGALGSTGVSLATNVSSPTLGNASTDSPSCTGATPGATARVNVNLLGTNLDAAPAGTYTGTLTLLITPV